VEITDVRLRKIETEGKLRAYVSITFDDSFVVHDLRVIDGNKGMFVAMPSKRLPNGPNGDHKDIAHPINTEIREKIQNAVLDVYHRELEEPPQVKAEPKVEEEVEESKEEEKEKVVEETATEEEAEKKEEGLF